MSKNNPDYANCHSFMTHLEHYTHFRRRILERYGLHINRENYNAVRAFIRSGNGTVIFEKGYLSVIKMRIPDYIRKDNPHCQYFAMLVVYEKRQRAVRSVLPYQPQKWIARYKKSQSDNSALQVVKEQ